MTSKSPSKLRARPPLGLTASAPAVAQPPPSSPPPSYLEVASTDALVSQVSHPPTPSQRRPHQRQRSLPSNSLSVDSSAASTPIRSRSTSVSIAVAAAATAERRANAISDAELEDPPPAATSALHPRVAVLLGVRERWHVPLQLCRALAMAPPVWWWLKCSWLFLSLCFDSETGKRNVKLRDEGQLVMTEIFLAGLWCMASAYLSFYFADCLMSRWLLNYTPSATLVRLLTISVINMYTTSWWIHLSGAGQDSRLLLPAWICIAITLTILYHLAHRHVNIRRETRAAVRVFWMMSTVSLFLLLMQLHIKRESWKDAPLTKVLERMAGAFVNWGERMGLSADAGRS